MCLSELVPESGELPCDFVNRCYHDISERCDGARFWIARRLGRRFSHLAGETGEPGFAPRSRCLYSDWYLFVPREVPAVQEERLWQFLRPFFLE